MKGTVVLVLISHLSFGCFSSLVSPIWGAPYDKHGRKSTMIRAGLRCLSSLWEVWPSCHLLLLLRLLNGVFTGFIPNATALIAIRVPKDKSESGSGDWSRCCCRTLTVPLLEVGCVEIFGILRNVFLLVGTFLF